MAEHGLLDNPLIADELMDRLCGGEGISEICRDDHMPDARTVYRKMARDADFAACIARAREAQQEAEVDAIVDMAEAATSEDWQVVKLRIHARQWRAAKLAPKKFGDKVLHGNDPDNPLPSGFDVSFRKPADVTASD